MPHAWRRTVVAVPAFLLVAGCSTDVTAPAVVAPAVIPAGHATATLPPNFRSNSQRYASTGRKPSTGRSGSASLQSRALLGKDGSTIVEATTGMLDSASTPPGQIAKLQLRNLTDSTTQNFNGLAAGGSWTTALAQVRRGSMLQVQANVRGIDRTRTDVVTVADTVWFRPDLAVSNVQNPSSVRVNTFADISARVAEKNGDLGAAANCVLTVDGQPAASALGIWVDKGDAVDCVFKVKFETLGTKQLVVSVQHVTPADWSDDNNSAASSIEVVSPETVLHGGANFNAVDYSYTYSSSNDYGCWYYYYCNYDETGAQNVRDLSMYGESWEAPAAVGNTMDFTLTRTTAGATSTANVTAYRYDWYWYYCGYGYDAATNTSVSYCRYPWYQNYVSVSLSQYSGHVQYYGSYDGWAYYSDNYTYGGGPYAFGSDVALDVRGTESGGNVFSMTATVPVTTSDYGYSYAYCDWWYGGCYRYNQAGTQSHGWTNF